MRRPRLSLPIFLKSLHYNPKIKRYEIIEGGFIYQMDLEHTRLLKEFYKNKNSSMIRESLEEWYRSLDKGTRKHITRIDISSIDDNILSY